VKRKIAQRGHCKKNAKGKKTLNGGLQKKPEIRNDKKKGLIGGQGRGKEERGPRGVHPGEKVSGDMEGSSTRRFQGKITTNIPVRKSQIKETRVQGPP